MAKKLIPAPELATYLKAEGYNARKLSDATGITTQAAYAILEGTTQPRKKVLDKLGLEVIFRPVVRGR